MNSYPCNEDILDPTLERSVIGSMNYLVSMTLGNAMLLGIVDFEHWGGDPMKRTVLNQLTSLACGSMILHGTLTGSIYQWIILTGPGGPCVAAIIILGRLILSIYTFMTFAEMILVQCLIVYKLESVVLLDDFLSRFLSRFNVFMSITTGGAYFVFDAYKNENYSYLSCQESR